MSDEILKVYIQSLEREKLHQKKVIDRLSRRIQYKNKKYRQLKAKKLPPTLYGREFIIVPDSIAKEIMIVNKDYFNLMLKEE